MKQRGFTLIELLVAIAVLGIVASIFAGAIGTNQGNGNISYGLNGMVESRCIEGYKFIVTHDSTRQVLDEFGKGVRCGNPDPGKPGSFGKF
jgi:prepilin-type N-terminal cleavage/methylation domain-containing protein